jgi:bacterioferritin-associated ferredoxin
MESAADLYAMMRPRKVCVCRSVTETQIRSAVRGGAHSFEDVQNQTECSTGCGTCESAVRSVIADELRQAGIGVEK